MADHYCAKCILANDGRPRLAITMHKGTALCTDHLRGPRTDLDYVAPPRPSVYLIDPPRRWWQR